MTRVTVKLARRAAQLDNHANRDLCARLREHRDRRQQTLVLSKKRPRPANAERGQFQSRFLRLLLNRELRLEALLAVVLV